MSILTPRKPRLLSEDDARLAESLSQSLRQLIGNEDRSFQTTALRISFERTDGGRTDLDVPGAALPLLLSILKELGQGKEVVTIDTELTTGQAASFLHVSRPYLVKLLERGIIPFRKAGPRRFVLLADVLRYMDETGDAAARDLDEMVAQNQILDLYP